MESEVKVASTARAAGDMIVRPNKKSGPSRRNMDRRGKLIALFPNLVRRWRDYAIGRGIYMSGRAIVSN